MRIIGCDLHARQQTISMIDTETGEVTEKTLAQEGAAVREFYAALPKPVLVGLEATGSMFWFLRLLEELGIAYRVGHPAAIRKAETRKQKHDRRDAELIRRLLEEKRFPQIWLPTSEQRDLRTLLQHRHQLVRMRVMTQNGLQGLALSQGLRRGAKLWSQAGQQALNSLSLADYSHTADVEAALVDIGDGAHEADYAGKDVRGKIVLADGVLARVQTLAVAKSGAAGIVSDMPNQTTAWSGLDRTIVRWGHLDARQPAGFAFMVSRETADSLRARLRAGDHGEEDDVPFLALEGGGVPAYNAVSFHCLKAKLNTQQVIDAFRLLVAYQ